MSITTTTVSTSVNPGDDVQVGWPHGRDVGLVRPWVTVPNGVFITMPADADAEAAEWWRRLARSEELVAKWYDRHAGRAGGAR